MNDLQVIFDGRSYVFQPGQTVMIGRLSENSIIIDDPTVSRRHAQLTWGPAGWVYENLGQARAFQRGQQVNQVLLQQPTELSLASPQGPVMRFQPLAAAQPQGPRPGAPPATPSPGGPPAGYGTPRSPGGPGSPEGYGRPGGYGPPGGPGLPGGAGVPAGAGAPGGFAPYGAPPGHPATTGGLAMAVEILVPIKSWLKNPGWHNGLRLLVIAYALLPLIFLALLSSSHSLGTPGFAYSVYIAPLWAIAFWLLLRPGRLNGQEIVIGIAIVLWVIVWLNVVTINVNDHLVKGVRNGSFLAALAVGYNEEISKALPVLLAALILLRFRHAKLNVRMWMFLGTIAGLTFGIIEEMFYTEIAIAQVANASKVSQADTGVLDFAFRVFVDGFEHAVWAAVSAFFIGIAVNYPRRRWQLIFFGVSIAAILHALNDWSLSTFNSYWPGIAVQALSLLLFLGYTMSATSIEREVRRTPLFRGDSMIMDMPSQWTDTGGSP
jgi:RsiW-degrading membrane proteinase PrsW (M82 family)